MSKDADYVVSLIGTNPIPSFITILKNCNERSRVYLVYTEKTESNIGTVKVADNLAKIIRNKLTDIHIQLFKCDKSDIEKIEFVTKKILEEVKGDVSVNSYIKRKLILDYSSGTKVMSAIFYDRFKKTKIDNCEIITSYVDDNSEKIIDSSFTNIKDILRDEKLSIDDITMLHGYKLINKERYKLLKHKTVSGDFIYQLVADGKVKLENSNGNVINVDSIIMLNGRIYVYFISKYIEDYEVNKGKGKCKMELFRIKDISEKLGGSRSGIIYKCNKDTKTIKELEKDLRRAYEFEMKKRLSILGNGQTLDDKLKEFQEFN